MRGAWMLDGPEPAWRIVAVVHRRVGAPSSGVGVGRHLGRRSRAGRTLQQFVRASCDLSRSASADEARRVSSRVNGSGANAFGGRYRSPAPGAAPRCGARAPARCRCSAPVRSQIARRRRRGRQRQQVIGRQQLRPAALAATCDFLVEAIAVRRARGSSRSAWLGTNCCATARCAMALARPLVFEPRRQAAARAGRPCASSGARRSRRRGSGPGSTRRNSLRTSRLPKVERRVALLGADELRREAGPRDRAARRRRRRAPRARAPALHADRPRSRSSVSSSACAPRSPAVAVDHQALAGAGDARQRDLRRGRESIASAAPPVDDRERHEVALAARRPCSPPRRS